MSDSIRRPDRIVVAVIAASSQAFVYPCHRVVTMLHTLVNGSHVKFKIVALAVMLALVVVIAPIRWRTRTPEDSVTSSSGYPHPMSDASRHMSGSDQLTGGPIYTSEQALLRSVDLLPRGSETITGDVKLVDYQTLDSIRGTSSPFTSPNSPVWVVGLIATNLTSENIMNRLAAPSMAEPGATISPYSSVPIPGVLYSWDANDGGLVGLQPLNNSSTKRSPQLSDITKMRSMNFTITTPTPLYLGTTAPGSNDSGK